MANRWICLSDKEIDFLEMVAAAYPDHHTVNEKDLKVIKKLEKAQKPTKVSSRKGKGRGLQYWVCEQVARILNIPFDQQDDNCLIHSREMGQSGLDVILRRGAQKRFPFAIECKNVENFNLTAVIRQVISNTPEGLDWMVVRRCKAIPEPTVTILWSTFEKIWMRGK
jgi:hypothetical protein